MLVLFQDYQDSHQKLAKHFLSRAGHECTAVAAPEDVVHFLKCHKPDLVVCEISEWLRSGLSTDIPCDIPVIVTGVFPDEDRVRKALSTGAVAYVAKVPTSDVSLLLEKRLSPGSESFFDRILEQITHVQSQPSAIA